MGEHWKPEDPDVEVEAMATVYRTLAPHSLEARERMMEWVEARLRSDDEKKSQLATPAIR